MKKVVVLGNEPGSEKDVSLDFLSLLERRGCLGVKPAWRNQDWETERENNLNLMTC